MPEDADEQAVAGAPCGACRTLRRRCVPGCVFAPYFTAEDFAAAHAVFGASNVSKMLERVALPEQRRVAAGTIVEEARARKADPTFGRVSYLRILQEVNDKAGKQVDDARAQIATEFGALAASLPVDVAAAPPEVWVEARAQVHAALVHARELDARLLAVRKANEIRWRELHPAEGTATGKHAGNWKGIDASKRHREPTMLMPRKQRRPPGLFPDECSHQQMAAAEAEREKALLMQHMSEASREEAMRSVHAAAAAPPPQRIDSAGQQDGRTGQPRRAGDDGAGRTPGQGTTSVLLEAMMQLAGAGDEKQQQQHLVAQHAENEHDVTQEMMQLQELLDMAELTRKQQIMKNDVMMEMAQWDASARGAIEQDVMTRMQQQIPANTWQHQEMPELMEEASTAELDQTTTTGNVLQQFAWAQQYHDDPVAAHHASPWHHQPAAASASQVGSEQDMLLSAGGARQLDNLAAQCHDDTELTLGYGHTDIHQQQQHAQNGLDIALVGNGHSDAETQAVLQELASIELARGQDVRTTMTQEDPDTAAWLLEKLEQLEKESMEKWEREMIMSRQAEAQKQLRINLGYGGHPHGRSIQGHLQAGQESFAMAERESKLEMLMRQFVAAGHAREQKLIEQQAVAAQQHQHHPVAQYSEKERKLEMLMMQVTAAGCARKQELIAHQAVAARRQQQQYSGTELDISPGQGHGHPYWHQPTTQQMLQEEQLPTVQQMLQEQQLVDAVGFGMHQANTTLAQQVANGEHGSGAGATMAFLSPGSAKDAPFLADQQWQPNGHQMDSSLPQLQASHQQRTDGGGEGLNSDLAAYLHYESLSRHGLAGNGSLQQG